MSQDLTTYLATPAAGAPATTAAELVFGLEPQFSDGQYITAETSDVVALSASQSKYDNILWPQPPETAIGLNASGLLALLTEATKNILLRLPIILSVTTNGSGVVTVDLTPYNLAEIPIVITQVLNPAADVTPIVSDITALTSTSLSLLTQVASTATPIGVTVHVAIHPVQTL